MAVPTLVNIGNFIKAMLEKSMLGMMARGLKGFANSTNVVPSSVEIKW